MLRIGIPLCLALAVTAGLAQEPLPLAQPVKEGNTERLMLDDGRDVDAATWSPAEAVLTVSPKHAKHGDSALRLHIEVDWKTGEPNYPVGWPRMNRTFAEGLQDWSEWDYLDFSIYVESSRENLPATPLGLGVYGSGSKADYNRTLSELKLGEWTDYRLPLSVLPSLNPRTGMQFFIAESNYRDGDVLDFWIDNISLVRYTDPTLTASRLAEQAIFSDSPYLLVDLDLMGVKPEAEAKVTWTLSTAGKAVATGDVMARRGKAKRELALPAEGVAPGDYELAVRGKGGGPAPFALKVVSSPWQEVPAQ